ncbi:uncharacterized protein MELLADRAFT_112433 [Melampsora larici-populina 98AG31]|uniref:Uncharacterized protein n=1 Tax=Melampsora larici-populina (strain 98AG31 / pathotype 3-4-7) TaxID=747676 RepID=F4S6G6_MELLP|nr:uncharacterized protein MELLADRAFT_112433 [Melampsora larici-populina 98AG31]EGF99687.1 hypothetical protein MELLADRAFT_112433 [Melampsora larici-populina 98AG31]
MASGQKDLPVEIVKIILSKVILQIPLVPSDTNDSADTPSLWHDYVTRVLQWRLLGRPWSDAIIRLLFQNLRLTRDPMIKSLMNMWTEKFAVLPSMRLRPGSLPNLAHFYISCHRKNRRAAIDICRRNERPISCLEMFPPSNPDPTAPIALGVTTTLKSLFIISIPDRVPHGIRNHIFPGLKVLRSEYCHSTEQNLRWLSWQMLNTVKIFITTYRSGNIYWRSRLNSNALHTFAKPPKLKHIVFIVSCGEETEKSSLANAFNGIGIQCHFMGPMNRAEIAGPPRYSLDTKLAMAYHAPHYPTRKIHTLGHALTPNTRIRVGPGRSCANFNLIRYCMSQIRKWLRTTPLCCEPLYPPLRTTSASCVPYHGVSHFHTAIDILLFAKIIYPSFHCKELSSSDKCLIPCPRLPERPRTGHGELGIEVETREHYYFNQIDTHTL